MLCGENSKVDWNRRAPPFAGREKWEAVYGGTREQRCFDSPVVRRCVKELVVVGVQTLQCELPYTFLYRKCLISNSL